MTNTPLQQFDGNEAYGGKTGVGLTIWSLGTNGVNPYADVGQSTIHGLRLWHVYDKGYYGYETNRLTFDHFVFRGDNSVLTNYGQGATALYSGDYFQKDFLVKNSDIQGAMNGWSPGTRSGGGTQTIQDSYLRNYKNIWLEHIYRAGNTAQNVDPRLVVIRDVAFAPALAGAPWARQWGPQSNIDMVDPATKDVENFIALDQVFVYDYNQVAGDNFQVYYQGQAADAIVPQSVYNSDGTTRITGAPVANLTNAQAWEQYGIAVAGAVAPSSAKKRTGIIGLVNPI